MPPLGDFVRRLEAIWGSAWLTNQGDQHRELEHALSEYLGAPHLSLFNNGTIALIVACRALRLAGEVITSPFTFPATAHVLSWNSITPVFADIDPDTLTIDPGAIEPLVTSATTGILGVHVYGAPCAVERIDTLARYYGLRVVYDGAHAFGTRIAGSPIASFGDATMFSFHATKLFHTGEGGALAVADPALKQRVDLLKNFGIRNEEEVVLAGINGKMNELQAALGLVVLEHVEAERARRAEIAAIYRSRLSPIEGFRLIDATRPDVESSRQYCVLRVDEAKCPVRRDELNQRLKQFNIFTRKYFFPLCSQFSCYRQLPSAQPGRLPHAERASREVLSLPFFGALSDDDVHRICDAIVYCSRETG
jgi:dTDP-4-amino-4,6-dideoxygalactose transaminase